MSTKTKTKDKGVEKRDPAVTKVKNRHKKKNFVPSQERGKEEFNFSFTGRLTEESCFHLKKMAQELGFVYISRQHIVQLMLQGLLSVQINGDEPIFGGEVLYPTPDGFLTQEGQKTRMKIRKVTVFLINHDANGGVANSPKIGLSFLWRIDRASGNWRMEVLL